MERLKLSDVLAKFAFIAEDLQKIPGSLEALPEGMDPMQAMKCVAAYYIGCFAGIVKQIEDEEGKAKK